LKSFIQFMIFWVDVQNMRGLNGFKRLVLHILPKLQSLSESEFSEVVKEIEGVWSPSEVRRLQKLYDDYRK